MPYPNFHSCRIKSPGLFQSDSFRTIQSGKLSIIIGRLKGETTTTTQAFRYSIEAYTESAARAHCEKNEGTFEAAAKEERKGAAVNAVMQTKSIQKEWSVDFIKVEEEKRLVTGIVIEPEVEDTYGDIISIEEIEKAMIRFMEGNPQIRVEHDPDYAPKVVIIENWIEREGRMIGEQFVKVGTWLMTTKVFDDDVWKLIKEGKLNGYSFRGPGLGVVESGVV